ncbi:hypothetical protein [Roseomonas gilardii]|uniref:hypothetical protein n=1 Tax=Roseomonas gilardii TaxID=257708 RepID=UPI000484FE7D|nr:hypothetical protein [Roseomonas gilardii]SUE44718.1 flagellar export protein FliJ [Roseomonas gilardii subsp. rosea]
MSRAGGRDPLAVLRRLRATEVEQAKRAFGDRLSRLATAERSAQAAEEALRHEAVLAVEPRDHASWLPLGLRQRDEAMQAARRAEAAAEQARAALAAARASERAVERLQERREAEAERHAAKAERQALDAAGLRGRTR